MGKPLVFYQLLQSPFRPVYLTVPCRSETTRRLRPVEFTAPFEDSRCPTGSVCAYHCEIVIISVALDYRRASTIESSQLTVEQDRFQSLVARPKISSPRAPSSDATPITIASEIALQGARRRISQRHIPLRSTRERDVPVKVTYSCAAVTRSSISSARLSDVMNRDTSHDN